MSGTIPTFAISARLKTSIQYAIIAQSKKIVAILAPFSPWQCPCQSTATKSQKKTVSSVVLGNCFHPFLELSRSHSDLTVTNVVRSEIKVLWHQYEYWSSILFAWNGPHMSSLRTKERSIFSVRLFSPRMCLVRGDIRILFLSLTRFNLRK